MTEALGKKFLRRIALIALKKGVGKSGAGVYNVNIKGCAAHGRLLFPFSHSKEITAQVQAGRL